VEAHGLPEALNLIMEQRGCSMSQLGRDLKRDQSWVSRVIKGEAGLDFAKVINLLARVGWEVVIRPKKPQREEEDPVKRREFVAGAASVMFVPSPKAGPYEDPSYLRELTRRVASAQHEHGGGTTASIAIKHIRNIRALVDSKDQELQEAASNLATEAVWTLNDARRFDAGDNVGGLALTLARRSGSVHAQSAAYSALANINAERGRKDVAFRFAEAGAKLREVPDVQRLWMNLRKGEIQAHLSGQEKAAREEIENVLGILRDTEGFPGQSNFDVADMTGNLGIVLADLGVFEEAQYALGQAVNLFRDLSPTPAAVYQAHQSMAALRASQVEQAVDHMLSLARFVPLINSPRVEGHVKKIHTMSARWAAVSGMRQAREQLRSVALTDQQTGRASR
jgi:tetratricopeptide (TPR) repeat protein